jgi:hypothetical protein
MQTTYKTHTYALFISFVLIGILALSILAPSRTHAVDYPCGTYSAGEYESDCALEEPASSPATSSSGSASTTSSTGTNSGATNPDGTTTDPAVDGVVTTDIPADAIVLNTFDEYLSDTGKRLDVTATQVIYLTVNREQHSITIKTIADSYVIVTIASTPTDVKIKLGGIVQYDVDKDGSNDLAISYFGPMSGVAVMNFRQLGQPATTAGVTDADTPTVATTNLVLIGIGVVGFLAAAGIVTWVIIAKRRKAAAQSQPFNSQPWQ